MQQILIATHNPSKIKRIQDNLILEQIQFLSPKDLNLIIKDPVENGKNEAENAKIKASAYFQVGLFSFS